MKFLSLLFTCFMIPVCAQSLVASEQASLSERMNLYLNRAINKHYYILSVTKEGQLSFLNRSVTGNSYVTSNEVFEWKAQQRDCGKLCSIEDNFEEQDDLDVTPTQMPSPSRTHKELRKELIQQAQDNQVWQKEYFKERKQLS